MRRMARPLRGDPGPVRWSRAGFWLIAIPTLAIAAVLMVRLASVAWELTSEPLEAPAAPEHGQLVWSRMGYMVLQGSDLVQVLGSAVVIGLAVGAAIALGTGLRQRGRRRPGSLT